MTLIFRIIVCPKCGKKYWNQISNLTTPRIIEGAKYIMASPTVFKCIDLECSSVFNLDANEVQNVNEDTSSFQLISWNNFYAEDYKGLIDYLPPVLKKEVQLNISFKESQS